MIPPHPLFRRFENCFDFRLPTTYKKVCIEWHFEEGDLFFRPRDANTNVLWHTLDILKQRTPEQAFHEALDARQLYCALPLAKTDFVFWNKAGGIFYRRGMDAGAAFSLPESLRWKGDYELFFRSCDKAINYLQTGSNAPSDFERARLLVENHFDGWFAVEVVNGSALMLRQLMQAIFEIYAVGGQNQHHYCTFGDTGQPCTFDGIPPKVMEIVKDHFKPFYHRRRRLRCFSGWHNRGEENPPAIQRQPLSMHERLEAIIMLRDFLRDKLPPEEIESLLRI